MKNWNNQNQLLANHSIENFLFPSRAVFFASSSGSSGGAGGKDEEKLDKNGKPLTGVESMAGSMSDRLLGSLNSTNKDDLLANLEKMKKDGKMSSTTFQKAKRLASSGTFSDRTLALRLTQGSVTAWRFDKIYDCLHTTEGDAHEMGLKKKLAEHELAAKISPSDFDLALSALEHGDDDQKQMAENFINDPKGVKEFKAFLDEHPVDQKKALQEGVLGMSGFEDQEDKLRKGLTEFTGVEAEDYFKTKMDTPEDAEKVRVMIREFGTESKTHIDAFDAFTHEMKNSVAKGDREVERAIEMMISECFQAAMTRDEKPIGEVDITRAIIHTRKETGIDLSKKMPKDLLKKMEGKLRYIQDLDLKISKKYGDITLKEFGPRTEEVMKRIRLKSSIDRCSRACGMSLKPGTKIRHKMEFTSEDGVVERRWVDTEIKGVFIEPPIGEKVEYLDEVFNPEKESLVIVTGAGRETFGRFEKWIMDTEAYQIIDTKEELEQEIQFDAMKLPLKEGMELEQRATGKKGSEVSLIKIAKLHKDGRIELDQEIDFRKPGSGTVAGQTLTEPIRKKILTYGEFAQLIKRQNIVPHLKTASEAETAYNNWKQVHGNPETVPLKFEAGSQMTYGPYEQNNSLAITKIARAPDGVEVAKVNSVDYRPSDLLRTAKNANWEQFDAASMAVAATASIVDPVKRALATTNFQKKLKAQEEEIADLWELAEQRHNLEDAHHAEEAAHAAPHAGAEHGAHAAPHDPEQAKREADEAKEEHLKEAAEKYREDNIVEPKQNAITQFWYDTQFLTPVDVMELGKSVWEYWKRTWERKQKNRYSKFGSSMPFISTEMLRIKEDTEHEEVGKFEHAIGHMGTFEVRGIMNSSSNQDQIKACIKTLSDRGHMRWDDVRMWEAVNRIPALAFDKRILIPRDGNPHSIVKVENGIRMTGMDMLKDAFESVWGDDNLYETFKNSNTSAYKSAMEKFGNEGSSLENDPYGSGGVSAKLKQLLNMHRNGEQVDPSQYEGLIKYIIKNGKATAEKKLYYIVLGVATNLLSIESIGTLDSDHCNVLPWLDFFTQAKNENKPVTLTKMQSDVPPENTGKHPFTMNDYKEMATFFDTKMPGEDENTAGINVKNFLWKKMLPHETTLTRTRKGSRNGDSMDHDDSHFILPLLDHEAIGRMCGSSTGRKKYFSDPGYLNGYPGFSEWMNTTAELGDDENLVRAIEAYVRFDGIISNRYDVKNEDLTRISDSVMDNGTVVDPLTPVNLHRDQMKDMILRIGRAAGRDWSILFDKVKRSSDDPGGKRQERIDKAINDFRKTDFRSAIEDLGKDKLFAIVRGTGLKGYEGNAKPEDVKKMLEDNERRKKEAGESAPLADAGE